MLVPWRVNFVAPPCKATGAMMSLTLTSQKVTISFHSQMLHTGGMEEIPNNHPGMVIKPCK